MNGSTHASFPFYPEYRPGTLTLDLLTASPTLGTTEISSEDESVSSRSDRVDNSSDGMDMSTDGKSHSSTSNAKCTLT